MNINITPILFLPSNTEFFDTIHNYLFYLLLSLIILYIFFIYNAFKSYGKEREQKEIKKQKTLNLEGFLFLQISVYASPLLTNNFSNNEGYPHMAIIKGA